MLTIEENSTPEMFNPQVHDSTACGRIHGDRFIVKNSLGQIVAHFATSSLAMEYIEWHCPCDNCDVMRDWYFDRAMRLR